MTMKKITNLITVLAMLAAVTTTINNKQEETIAQESILIVT